MGRTRKKNVFRNIRNSLNRFLSIMFIVALGSGFMAGLSATTPDMFDAADRYAREFRMYDIDLKCAVGFDSTDASEIKKIGGIAEIQCARALDFLLNDEYGNGYTARVFSILDDSGNTGMNRVRIIEGRMPENAGECVIQSTMSDYMGGSITIGSELSFAPGDSTYQQFKKNITHDRLTVVGIVEGPMCVGIAYEPSTAGTGMLTLNVYTTEALFESEYYTDIFIRVSVPDSLSCFSDEYKTTIASISDKISALASNRSELRASRLEYDAKKTADELFKIMPVVKSADNGIAQIRQDAFERLDDNTRVAEILRGSSPLLAELLEETGELIASNPAPNDNGSTLIDRMRYSEKSISAAAAMYSKTEWMVNTRDDNAAFSSYKSNVGKVSALAKLFPAFFFLVALLVALTTMTRLIEENRTQNGTLKALGFSSGELLSEYLNFSLISSLLGCALGFSVGFRLFPKAISLAYGMMYSIPDMQTPFRANIAIWVAPVTVGSIMLAAAITCRNEFRTSPAELMRPKSPPAGKKIFLEKNTFLWKKLPFVSKITLRNIFRYRKRFYMTIIGVSGCTALLVAGFGLRDSINDIVDKQFGDIYVYDITAMLDTPFPELSDDELTEYLSDPESVTDFLPCTYDNVTLRTEDGRSESIDVIVPSDADRLSGFIDLKKRTTGEKLSLEDGGIVLTEKLCEEFHISVGDRVNLRYPDGTSADFTVTGLTEHYISSYAYLSVESYSSAFGKEPEYKTLLVALADKLHADSFAEQLLSKPHVLFLISAPSLKLTFAEAIKSVDGVVIVLIIAAGLLSAVVLYNLTNVNICERRKELATFRVLGFTRREVRRYIFRESNILSLIGSLFGLPLGTWLHSFIVKTVEIEMMMFGRSVYLRSYIIAFCISTVFSRLVNLALRKQISDIDMVEAMKAND